jgi:Fe2+ transport system protein FeoA
MSFNLTVEPDLASLADLREGQTAVLESLSLPQRTSEHLMWLGFVPGVAVTACQSGPGGDPRVYSVGGSAFALRRETAQGITIRFSDGVEA